MAARDNSLNFSKVWMALLLRNYVIWCCWSLWTKSPLSSVSDKAGYAKNPHGIIFSCLWGQPVLYRRSSSALYCWEKYFAVEVFDSSLGTWIWENFSPGRIWGSSVKYRQEISCKLEHNSTTSSKIQWLNIFNRRIIKLLKGWYDVPIL